MKLVSLGVDEIWDIIPDPVRNLEDPFSKNLIDLWDKRYMKGKVFLVSEDGKYCGYVLLEEGRKWTIRGFFVQPGYRNRGSGNRLLSLVCQFVDGKKQDCLVNITKGKEKIYIDHGFEILGPRSDFPGQVKAIRRYKQ